MKFNVLIVEDETELWANPMERALKKLADGNKNNFSIEIDIAADGQSAQQAMIKKCYHFLSLDQHIPEILGEGLALDKGLKLSKTVRENTPLSRYIAFTGRLSPDEITKIADQMQTGNDNVWLKNTHLNAKQWAEKVFSFLQNDYFDWYYNRGKDYLPLPLAVASAKIAQSGYFKQPKTDSVLPALRAVCEFWEITLHIAWLQGLAENRKKPVFNNPRPNDKEQQLESMLPSLAKLYPNACVWNKNDFLEASKQLRSLRNKFAHAMGRVDGWEQELESIKPALKIFNDAAACWAGAPLVHGLQLQQEEASGLLQVQAQLLKGTSWPWPLTSIRLHKDQPIAANKTVYACVNGDFETGFKLLSLQGLLWVDYDSRANRNRLYAYSHEDANKRKWKVDLETGQTSYCSSSEGY